MFGLNVLKINIQGTSSSGGFVAGTLTGTALDSDANSFTVSNVVKNPVRINFLVAADVKNSSAADFTVFT